MTDIGKSCPRNKDGYYNLRNANLNGVIFRDAYLEGACLEGPFLKKQNRNLCKSRDRQLLDCKFE
ncbi:MAG: pentapeptide repeat-containing protein [Leptospiraceae bacterium]|nr:pentapeptide repeat-containing protein [Leptospiraceae bacterium]MCP5503189.1 pentapeptide repeat-containing protein [Leptospiraceae bacterium]